MDPENNGDLRELAGSIEELSVAIEQIGKDVKTILEALKPPAERFFNT